MPKPRPSIRHFREAQELIELAQAERRLLQSHIGCPHDKKKTGGLAYRHAVARYLAARDHRIRSCACKPAV